MTYVSQIHLLLSFKKYYLSQFWWYMPGILVFAKKLEGEEFQYYLGYILSLKLAQAM